MTDADRRKAWDVLSRIPCFTDFFLDVVIEERIEELRTKISDSAPIDEIPALRATVKELRQFRTDCQFQLNPTPPQDQ